MSQKNSISVVIIAKNEAERIQECINTVAWADEIIVVDNGSRDSTAEIAKRMKARVFEKAGMDFSALRDYGASVASCDWLLYIDADERVTQKLQEEILRNVQKTITAAFFISRKNFYLGHIWPTKDKMIRLIKKDCLISWQGQVHEHPDIQGTVEACREPLVHDTHRTISEMVEKTNQWSEIEADLRIRAHHPPVVWWRFLRVMCTAFNETFVKQQGWKAGTVGWVESIYQAFSIFITYAKVWERQQKKV